MTSSEINDPVVRRAVEAIDKGDVTGLQSLLKANPGLPTIRLDAPAEGYFARPYLLWFVADNPIRLEKMPPNIIESASMIVDLLRRNSHDSIQHQLDYTLALVATGRVPRESGDQLPLMELLIKSGAKVGKSILGVIGEYNMEAAEYLLSKGADYNLAVAVGFNKADDIKNLAKKATPSTLYVALVVASFFGNADAISILLKAGADVNGHADKEDFGGFHSHASPLHQATYSGSMKAIELLVEAGADLNAIDTVYNGKPLDWAHHILMEQKEETKKKKYEEAIKYLSAK